MNHARRTAARGLLWASAPLLAGVLKTAGLKEEKPEGKDEADIAQRDPWERNGRRHPCTRAGKYVKGCHELKIFSGRSHPALAKEVAELLGTTVARADVSSFMDGETRIQITDSVRGHDVYVIQSCTAPVNDRIMELLLFIATMHRASAKHVTAVIPYFAYKHHRREHLVAIDKRSRYLGSPAQDFAKMLTVVGVDRVIAVELQRPGVDTESTFFEVPVQNCMTERLGIDHYAKHNRLLQGGKVTVVAPNPDVVKKAQIFRHGLMAAWGEEVGEDTQCQVDKPPRVGFAMFSRPPVVKGSVLQREAELLGDVCGADVVIVDEMVDTANTLLRVAAVLKAKGAKNIYVFASHGLFNADALFKIEQAKDITGVAVTNTIPLPPSYTGKKVTQLSIAPLLARLIEASHFRRHLYNEEAPVLDPESM